MGDEMLLRDFLGSFWFRKLWQVGIIVCAGASSYAGVSMAMVQGRITTVETGLASIGNTQAQRALDGEKFQALITSEVRSVDANVDSLGSKLAEVQISLARMAGVMEEMQRRDVAQRTRLQIE